jgi:protein-S-isoprenylcysteine O-methyltransferase Ste14
MNKPAPSPRRRQALGAGIIVILGLVSISCGQNFHLTFAVYPVLEVLAALLIIAGIVVRVLAQREIRNTWQIDRLVTSGIYARTRNSVYLAFSLIIAGLALISLTYLAFIWLFIAVSLMYWAARQEEKDLEKAFGHVYLRYKAAVPAFFPWFRRHIEID